MDELKKILNVIASCVLISLLCTNFKVPLLWIFENYLSCSVYYNTAQSE